MTKINILFSTKNNENTLNLLNSIQKNESFNTEKTYTLSITVFDKTIEQNILCQVKKINLNIVVITQLQIQKLEEKYPTFFYSSHCSTKIDSIQRARIQQQLYVNDNLDFFEHSIIWQVDDDMLFGKSIYVDNQHLVDYSTPYFSEVVRLQQQHKNLDAIIAPSSYVPPIPSLLYCETQLEDYFNRVYAPQHSLIPLEYHDYYTQKHAPTYYSVFLSNAIKGTEVVKDILLGKPITKALLANNSVPPSTLTKSKLLRGGNFIVFNTAIFKIPHLGFVENENMSARRSDMIHAHLLHELGFEINDAPYFSLVHNRTFSSSSIENCIQKYFADIIGALLVQYLYKGEKEFENRLVFHQKHIKRILNLLYKNTNNTVFEKEIEQLIALDNRINAFDKKYFVDVFEKFKKSKEQLKLKLCKLV